MGLESFFRQLLDWPEYKTPSYTIKDGICTIKDGEDQISFRTRDVNRVRLINRTLNLYSRTGIEITFYGKKPYIYVESSSDFKEHFVKMMSDILAKREC